MATETNCINKSEVVRKILHEIGAVSENPPKNWRTSVEERLSKQKGDDGKPMKMAEVTIYQIRRKEINKKSGKNSKKSGKSGKFSRIESLVEVKKFADTFGGLDQLEQAINFLKQLG